MTEFPEIEPNEKFLLEILNNYWINNKKITVSETLDINSKFSRATVHKYLKSLRSKGYLELIIDDLDNRFKYVLPTNLTSRYFNELGRLLVESAGNK